MRRERGLGCHYLWVNWHKYLQNFMGSYLLCEVLGNSVKMLKEHIALDRMSWSIKSIFIRLLWNAYG